jgi:protein-disulfide isomerase
MSAKTRRLTVMATAATIVAVLTVGARLLGWGGMTPRVSSEHVPDWRAHHRQGIRVGAADPVLSVVVFSDYFCPACRAAHSGLDGFVDRHRDDVAVIWRHCPFMARSSETAAIAAQCADAQGEFERVHERLFVRSPFEPMPDWGILASELGVRDSENFVACASDSATKELVRLDKTVARRLGIRATPTIIVDSLMYRGFPGEDVLEWHLSRASRGRR